jgi:hypothetical protein
MGFVKKQIKQVSEAISDVGSAIDDAIIQPVVNTVEDIVENPAALLAVAALVYPPLIPSVGTALGATGAAIPIVGAAALSTGASLISGNSLEDALTTGAVSGLTAGLLGPSSSALDAGMGVYPISDISAAVGGTALPALDNLISPVEVTGTPAPTDLLSPVEITGTPSPITDLLSPVEVTGTPPPTDLISPVEITGTPPPATDLVSPVEITGTPAPSSDLVSPVEITGTPVSAVPVVPTLPLSVTDAIRLAGVITTIAAADAATNTTGSTGFPIVPVPEDWTSPVYQRDTAVTTPLAPIDFGSRELLRGTQWERLLSPDYGKVPAPMQYTQPSNMSYSDLVKILGGLDTMPSRNLTINDVISGIQNQYGQTPSSTVGEKPT